MRPSAIPHITRSNYPMPILSYKELGGLWEDGTTRHELWRRQLALGVLVKPEWLPLPLTPPSTSNPS